VKRNRLAAIDLGTNSVRCIVVEVDKLGKFKVLDDEKASVRLGEGIVKEGAISQAAWQRTMDALSRMKKIIDGYGVIGIETVATNAVRQAANGAAFVKAAADNIGLSIDIISGEEEAELATLSALNNFDMEGTRYAMVDIGGGSVEVITALGSHIDEVFSLELGAVNLTENFITTDPINQKEYLRLRRHVRKTLKAAFTSEEIPVHCLLGGDHDRHRCYGDGDAQRRVRFHPRLRGVPLGGGAPSRHALKKEPEGEKSGAGIESGQGGHHCRRGNRG